MDTGDDDDNTGGNNNGNNGGNNNDNNSGGNNGNNNGAGNSGSNNGGGSSGGGSVSAADQQRYLNAHNSVRAQHGAGALSWADDLEAAAQKWANNCVFKHSGGTLGPFGENLAAGTGNSYTIETAVKSWTDEVCQWSRLQWFAPIANLTSQLSSMLTTPNHPTSPRWFGKPALKWVALSQTVTASSTQASG